MILIMMIIVNCTITTSQAVFLEMLNLKSTLSVRATAKTGKTEDGLEYEVLSDGTGVSITDYTGTQTEVVIPGTIGELPVLEIGSYAFASCSSLTSITIPDSVTRIGISAFSGCSSLTAIMVEEANIKFVSIDGVLYDKEKTELYCYPAGKRETSYAILEGVERIRVYAFRECSNLIDVIIPKSVIEIESNAFIDCSGLINITLPESLRIIGKGAFLGCSSLTSITIPDRVSYIWDSVFLGCASLVEINVEEKIIIM